MIENAAKNAIQFSRDREGVSGVPENNTEGVDLKKKKRTTTVQKRSVVQSTNDANNKSIAKKNNMINTFGKEDAEVVNITVSIGTDNAVEKKENTAPVESNVVILNEYIIEVNATFKNIAKGDKVVTTVNNVVVKEEAGCPGCIEIAADYGNANVKKMKKPGKKKKNNAATVENNAGDSNECNVKQEKAAVSNDIITNDGTDNIVKQKKKRKTKKKNKITSIETTCGDSNEYIVKSNGEETSIVQREKVLTTENNVQEKKQEKAAVSNDIITNDGTDNIIKQKKKRKRKKKNKITSIETTCGDSNECIIKTNGAGPSIFEGEKNVLTESNIIINKETESNVIADHGTVNVVKKKKKSKKKKKNESHIEGSTAGVVNECIVNGNRGDGSIVECEKKLLTQNNVVGSIYIVGHDETVNIAKKKKKPKKKKEATAVSLETKTGDSNECIVKTNGEGASIVQGEKNLPTESNVMIKEETEGLSCVNIKPDDGTVNVINKKKTIAVSIEAMAGDSNVKGLNIVEDEKELATDKNIMVNQKIETVGCIVKQKKNIAIPIETTASESNECIIKTNGELNTADDILVLNTKDVYSHAVDRKNNIVIYNDNIAYFEKSLT